MANRRNIDKLCSSTQDHRTFHFSVLFSKFLTTVNLYNGRANTKSFLLGKIFFGTHLEHRMRLHIGKRHCDEWIAHHCKPKDGGGDKRKFKKPSIRRKNKGARRQLKANDTIRITTLGSFKTLDFSWIHDCLNTYRFNKVWYTDLPWSKDKYWIW